MFPYFVFGAACSEVEIDCLTGAHTVLLSLYSQADDDIKEINYYHYFQTLRTDIVIDIGQSLNPAIDIGQIEGAFIMASIWFILSIILKNSEA